MDIPKSIIDRSPTPHWCGEVNNEQVEIYLDEHISNLSSSVVYAVFSNLGFHGWMDEGYDQNQVLWLVTGITYPYEKALNEYEQNQELIYE